MINLVPTTQEIAKASNNILPYKATFNDVHDWNYDSNSVVTNSILKPYLGERSCLITCVSTSLSSFNYGSDDLKAIVTPYGAGSYILSCRLFKNDPTADVIFTIKMSINGVVTANTTFTADLFNSNGFIDNVWNTYFQNITLADNDEVDFSFEVQSDTIGTKLFFDGFKLELDDRNLGLPSTYTEAFEVVTEVENVIDIPSISSNSTYVVELPFLGVLPTDYLAMRVDSALGNSGLQVGDPLYSGTNLVKVVIHNHSGSSSSALNNTNFYLKKI